MSLRHEITPPGVWGDGHRLAQVVLNLMSNAIKYTPADGRIDVTLRAHDGRVQLLVRDAGCGIPAEFLPHVFEPFTQFAAPSGTPGAGLGLGMAIVREVVQRHGGTAYVASAGPGLGTTVTITLPAVNAPDAGGAPETPRLAGRSPR